MRRPALLLALLAVPIALGFYLFWGGEQSELSGVEAEDPSSGQGVEGRDDLGAGDRAREAMQVGEPSGETETGSDSAIGESLIANIRVVDEESGEAVPFAEVAVLSEVWNWFGMSVSERHRVQRFGADTVALYSDFGRMERADERGELHLPIDTAILLACENGGRFGQLYLKAEDLDAQAAEELLLQADGSISVRVVDAVGAPVANMPLGLRAIWGDARDAQNEARFHAAFPAAYTNEAGEARIPRIPRWLARETRVVGEPDEAAIRMLIPCLHEDSHVFDPRNPPAEAIEITAPSSGSVLVRVLDTTGELLVNGPEIFLQQGPSRTQLTEAPIPRWIGQPADAGETLFPFVALGQELSIEVLGGDFPDIQFAGPTRIGQQVKIDLRAASDLPILRGQLVDQNLQPLGRMHLKIPFSGENFGSNAYMLTTSDADGRFRYEFSRGHIGEHINLPYLQEQVLTQNARLIAELGTDLEIRKGSQDLGRIIMAPAPLLVSGRVTMDGQILGQQAQLAVEFLDPAQTWRPLSSAALSWPAAGSFVLAGLPAAGRHRIVASSADALAQDPIEFRVGQQDLLIELQRGGNLQLEILLEEPTLANGLAVELLAVSAGPDSSQPPLGRLEPDTAQPSMSWRGLEPGDYRIEVRAFGMAEPLLSIDGLQVLAGRACEDPRIHPLDLRGKVREVSISLLDASSQPLDVTGTVLAGQGDKIFGNWVFAGHAKLIIAAPVDLEVAVPGYEMEELRAVDADRSVQLRALPVIELELPAIDLPAGVSLTLFARPLGLPIDELSPRYGVYTRRLRSHTRPAQERFSLGEARRVQVPLREGEELDLRLWIEEDEQGKDLEALLEKRIPATRRASGSYLVQVNQQTIRAAIQAGKR
ncbi:MAG: hypothetical protein ACYTG5_08825 [Planctomycetota bacterium]|jgi:hypothetical protein